MLVFSSRNAASAWRQYRQQPKPVSHAGKYAGGVSGLGNAAAALLPWPGLTLRAAARCAAARPYRIDRRVLWRPRRTLDARQRPIAVALSAACASLLAWPTRRRALSAKTRFDATLIPWRSRLVTEPFLLLLFIVSEALNKYLICVCKFLMLKFSNKQFRDTFIYVVLVIQLFFYCYLVSLKMASFAYLRVCNVIFY